MLYRGRRRRWRRRSGKPAPAKSPGSADVSDGSAPTVGLTTGLPIIILCKYINGAKQKAATTTEVGARAETSPQERHRTPSSVARGTHSRLLSRSADDRNETNFCADQPSPAESGRWKHCHWTRAPLCGPGCERHLGLRCSCYGWCWVTDAYRRQSVAACDGGGRVGHAVRLRGRGAGRAWRASARHCGAGVRGARCTPLSRAPPAPASAASERTARAPPQLARRTLPSWSWSLLGLQPAPYHQLQNITTHATQHFYRLHCSLLATTSAKTLHAQKFHSTKMLIKIRCNYQRRFVTLSRLLYFEKTKLTLY